MIILDVFLDFEWNHMNITIDYYPGCDPNEFISLFGLFVQGLIFSLSYNNFISKSEIEI